LKFRVSQGCAVFFGR